VNAQPESGQVEMEFCKDACDDQLVPRPATGETPVTNFRIPKRIVQAAKAKAKAEGRTLTDVIVAYLRRYISTPPRKKADADG
jgi:hypothetical protein